MPDLGTKHECTSCGVKFYDFGKADPLCPKCQSPLGEEDEAGAKKKVRGKAAAAKKKKKKKAAKKPKKKPSSK